MTDDRDWPIDKILGHVLVSRNKTLFRVKWANSPTIPDYTEPLEHFMNVPLVVKKFISSSMKDRKKKTGKSYKGDIFPRPPGATTRALRKEGDFVPQGSERVKKIYMELVTKEVEHFYLVKFFYNEERVLVRRAVMEYFFPLDCLIFMKKRLNRSHETLRPSS